MNKLLLVLESGDHIEYDGDIYSFEVDSSRVLIIHNYERISTQVAAFNSADWKRVMLVEDSDD